MNATDFIKRYGLNTAIRITEDSKNDDFWDTETGFYTDKNSESCVCILELKRVVESVDFINKFGGIEKAKSYQKYCDKFNLYVNPRLKQAIADYQSIYSNDIGDDTRIENHVSPLCHHHWVDGLDGGTLVCAHKCGAWK